MWEFFCQTILLHLSLNILLETDHLLRLVQRYGMSVVTRLLGNRRISISLRKSLRPTVLEKPTVTWSELSEALLFYTFVSLF